MSKIKYILIGLALMSTFALSAAYQRNEFCNGLECPEYELTMQATENIEIRKYNKSSWVSTEMKNGSMDSLKSKGFWTLYNYISGKNANKEKIEMSAPVLTKMNSNVAFTENDTVGTMSFYLGHKYESEVAPQPEDSNAFLSTLESKTYAVISYGGYSNQNYQEEHLRILGSYLEKSKLKYVKEYYFIAGYDSPFRFIGRHNEVWIELI